MRVGVRVRVGVGVRVRVRVRVRVNLGGMRKPAMRGSVEVGSGAHMRRKEARTWIHRVAASTPTVAASIT